jgi:anti-anti-sigma regulatory factor
LDKTDQYLIGADIYDQIYDSTNHLTINNSMHLVMALSLLLLFYNHKEAQMVQNIELFTITACKIGGEDAVSVSGFMNDAAIPSLRSYFLNRCIEPERNLTIDMSGVIKISPLVISFIEDVALKLYRLHSKLILVNVPEFWLERFSLITTSHRNMIIIDETEESSAVYAMTGLRCF